MSGISTIPSLADCIPSTPWILRSGNLKREYWKATIEDDAAKQRLFDNGFTKDQISDLGVHVAKAEQAYDPTMSTPDEFMDVYAEQNKPGYSVRKDFENFDSIEEHSSGALDAIVRTFKFAGYASAIGLMVVGGAYALARIFHRWMCFRASLA